MDVLPVSSRADMEKTIDGIMHRNNIRSTVRLTGIPQNKVKAIVMQVGKACERHHAMHVKAHGNGKLRCGVTKVLHEKIHGSVQDPRRHLAIGSAWTWTCIDIETRFVSSWFVAPRNAEIARRFLTEARETGGQVEMVGNETIAYDVADNDKLTRIFGSADGYLSTIEPPERPTFRSDPSCRIDESWLGAIPYGFARKVHRHSATLALFFAYHNFVSRDSSGRVSPAMAAGITNRIWRVSDIAGLVW